MRRKFRSESSLITRVPRGPPPRPLDGRGMDTPPGIHALSPASEMPAWIQAQSWDPDPGPPSAAGAVSPLGTGGSLRVSCDKASFVPVTKHPRLGALTLSWDYERRPGSSAQTVWTGQVRTPGPQGVDGVGGVPVSARASRPCQGIPSSPGTGAPHVPQLRDSLRPLCGWGSWGEAAPHTHSTPTGPWVQPVRGQGGSGVGGANRCSEACEMEKAGSPPRRVFWQLNSAQLRAWGPRAGSRATCRAATSTQSLWNRKSTQRISAKQALIPRPTSPAGKVHREKFHPPSRLPCPLTCAITQGDCKALTHSWSGHGLHTGGCWVHRQ